MMPNDNIEVVRQYQMVVAWIRLRWMKKLKETKPNGQFTSSEQLTARDKNSTNNKNNKNDINNKSNTINNNNNKM